MPILMSLMTNGLTVMPKTSKVVFGPKGMTANPIMAGTMVSIGARAEHGLVRAGRHDVFLEEQFDAVGDRLKDAIGADFHRTHAILHPAEHFPLGMGQDHDRQHHDAHDRGDLGERNCKSQA